MNSRSFGDIGLGDLFRLEGRLYRKRGKYSAILLRSESGVVPMMSITRMIHPDSTVVAATEAVPAFSLEG